MYFAGVIYVAGQDSDCTMSNEDSTLYLRARRILRGKTVQVRSRINVSHSSYIVIYNTII